MNSRLYPLQEATVGLRFASICDAGVGSGLTKPVARIASGVVS